MSLVDFFSMGMDRSRPRAGSPRLLVPAVTYLFKAGKTFPYGQEFLARRSASVPDLSSWKQPPRSRRAIGTTIPVNWEPGGWRLAVAIAGVNWGNYSIICKCR